MKLITLGANKPFAQVDDADFEAINQYVWTLIEWRGKQYAKRKARHSDDKYPVYETMSMHWLITGWDYVDHIDGNGLNNQRSNLRQATHKQNLQNQKVQKRSKSGYRGVSFFPRCGKWLRKKPWRARIKVDGIDTTLGYYATPEEAARVWNQKAQEVWGEYAFQNTITEDRR